MLIDNFAENLSCIIRLRPNTIETNSHTHENMHKSQESSHVKNKFNQAQ
jgi:hypothetical protein